MSIHKETVEYIAALSRMNLSEQEAEQLSVELETIVKYMDILSQLPTEDMEPANHVFPLHNVLREDRVVPSHDRSSLLANAPETDGVTFSVPKAVD